MQKIFYVSSNKRKDFHELWEQRKQLKTMEMNEASPAIYDGCINQFQPDPTDKIQ